MSGKLENFERAFTSQSSGCVRRCDCGRQFFHNTETGYDWEEGEFEALLKSTSSTGLDYSVETLIVEGKEFAVDCTCWHKRASKIMDFIDSHAHKIAEYLKLEKKRKQAIADAAPTVDL